tara:strand:- start:15110 stop:15325 length:216 start_codon:yes stop_codon:yes gene_type:complete
MTKGVLNHIHANQRIYNTPTKVLEALLEDAKDSLDNAIWVGDDNVQTIQYWKGRVASLKIALVALNPGMEL